MYREGAHRGVEWASRNVTPISDNRSIFGILTRPEFQYRGISPVPTSSARIRRIFGFVFFSVNGFRNSVFVYESVELESGVLVPLPVPCLLVGNNIDGMSLGFELFVSNDGEGDGDLNLDGIMLGASTPYSHTCRVG
jgi:hypothetical protein